MLEQQGLSSNLIKKQTLVQFSTIQVPHMGDKENRNSVGVEAVPGGKTFQNSKAGQKEVRLELGRGTAMVAVLKP